MIIGVMHVLEGIKSVFVLPNPNWAIRVIETAAAFLTSGPVLNVGEWVLKVVLAIATWFMLLYIVDELITIRLRKQMYLQMEETKTDYIQEMKTNMHDFMKTKRCDLCVGARAYKDSPRITMMHPDYPGFQYTVCKRHACLKRFIGWIDITNGSISLNKAD